MQKIKAELPVLKERLEKRGINGNLIRYSVGFENVEDVFEDFSNAFRILKR